MTSSAKRLSQHLFYEIFTPYLSQLLTISLMNMLNNIGDKGQPCLTPW